MCKKPWDNNIIRWLLKDIWHHTEREDGANSSRLQYPQRDILAPYLFINSLDYVLRTSMDLMKENGFKLAKERRKRYPAQNITDADYAYDIALLAKSLLHSLEWAACGIGVHVNTDKTEYMCFNQRGDISTLNGGPLKLGYKFTYLGSSISSTENNINMRLAKAWTAIDRLSVIWKSDLTNKIKHSFSKQRSSRYCNIDAPYGH